MTDSGRYPPPDCKTNTFSNEDLAVLDQSVDDEVELFAALANDTRYRILRLVDSIDEPVCGCSLEPHLDVGQSSISQSLSRLRSAGLLTRTKDGRWRYYDTTPLAETLLESLERDRPMPSL